MPLRSQQQWKWMWANHPKMAERWTKHTSTPFSKLPKKVDQTKEAGNFLSCPKDSLLPSVHQSPDVACLPFALKAAFGLSGDGRDRAGFDPSEASLTGIPGLLAAEPAMKSARFWPVPNPAPVSLLSLVEQETKNAGLQNEPDVDISPYLARVNVSVAAQNILKKRAQALSTSHETTKASASAVRPVTDFQAQLVIPHVGHLKTPTAAALHALQQRKAEEAAELAKKTKTDAPPPGFHQTDAAQQSIGFQSGAAGGDQPGSGTSVGPGNSPSSHPITSYSGLGTPGTVNGNAAFGTRNNSLMGAAKTGNDRSQWESYNGPLSDDQMDSLTMGHGCVLGSCGHRIAGCRCHGGKLIREKRAELCHECQQAKTAGYNATPAIMAGIGAGIGGLGGLAAESITHEGSDEGRWKRRLAFGLGGAGLGAAGGAVASGFAVPTERAVTRLTNDLSRAENAKRVAESASSAAKTELQDTAQRISRNLRAMQLAVDYNERERDYYARLQNRDAESMHADNAGRLRAMYTYLSGGKTMPPLPDGPLEKQNAIEPLPRWKKEPQAPLDPEFIAQPGVQNLLEALGMDVSGTGALIAKKIARCEAGAIIADGEQDKEAGFGNALRAVGTNSLRAAKTLAGVPAGQSFAAKPVRNTIATLGMRGVKPMRQLGNVALGTGALSVGGQAYDTVNNLVHAPQRMAETIGKPLGLPQTEIDGMAGDIGEHSVGAIKELFTPGFLRSNDTPAAQAQRELGRKLLWNQARSAFYEATHDTSQESTWDKARRLMGYRTPLSATVTEAVDRGPAYVSEMIGKGQAMRPELMRYMQDVDSTTPLGQRAADLSKRMYGRISTGIGKAGADKEAGLHELVTHPATPFVVQPVVGAVGGLAMNEVMRHLLDTYYGRELPQKTIDRERVQAAGMGAGMGLVRAALPHASESIMKMLDPGPSGTV